MRVYMCRHFIFSDTAFLSPKVGLVELDVSPGAVNNVQHFLQITSIQAAAFCLRTLAQLGLTRG